jgi:hypothetical protein
MGIFDTVKRGLEGRSQWHPCGARNMAERVGFEFSIQRHINSLQGHG